MRVAAAFCLQAFAILILGAGLCRLFAPRRPLSWSLAVPFGFLGLFTLTEVLALPLTLLQVPLSVFTFLLTVCLLAAAAVILVRRRTDIKAMFVRLPRLITAHGAAGLLMAAAAAFQLWITFVYVDYSVDAGYYVGKAATDAWTNRMGLYEPTTGTALRSLNLRYLFSCFPDYNAAMAQLTGAPAILQAKKIVPLIAVAVSLLIFYRIGLKLFARNPKAAGLFVFFVSIIRFWSGTLFTDGTFFITRTYEGKALLAGVVIPAAIYAFLILFDDPSRTELRFFLLAASVSGICFSSTSLVLLPFLLGAGSASLLLRRRNKKELLWAVIILLPVLCALGMYGLFKLHVLSAAIRW